MHNPYQPPAAAVADVPDTGELTRPIVVTRAVQIFWATVALGFVLGVIDLIGGLDGTPGTPLGWVMQIGVFAVGLAISYWIYGAVYAGRNWARILMLVLTMVWLLVQIVLVVMLQRYPQAPPGMMLNLISYAVQFALNLVATAMLFAPSANRWYRAMKAAQG
jgi:hypothetical protein